MSAKYIEAFYMVKAVLGAASLFVGFLTFVLVIPMLMGKVKMNPLYGARMPKSFESEENWYKINKYAAKMMIYFCSIPLFVLGIGCFVLPINNPFGINNHLILMLVVFVLMMASVLIPSLLTLRYSNRL